TIEIPAELDGVFQFGDFYGEQLSIDFEQNLPARAAVFADETDDGSFTTAKRATFAARLRDAILNLTPSIDLSDLNINYVEDGANKKGLDSTISAVLNSVPQSFVCKDGGMEYSISSDGKFTLLSLGLKADAASMRADYDNEKQAVLNSLFPNGTSGMSKTEIALAIHDYLALHTRYDYAAVESGSKDNPNMYNAYGVLVNGLAVCHGYALAYMDLLSKNGVKSYFVSSKNIDHAWLIIETEKGWYHSDVTWDDPRLEAGDYTNDGDYMGYCQHDYFMNTEANIRASHFKNATYDATTSVLFDKTPAAAVTAHGNSGFWSGIRCGMAYIDGKWYYNDSMLWKQTVNGTVVRHTKGNIYSTPYGTKRQANDVIAENATAFAVVDGRLVYGKFSTQSVTDAIMCYNTEKSTVRKLKDVEGNTIVTEIAAGRLNLNNSFYGRGTVVYTDMNYQLHTVNPKEVPGKGDVNADGKIDIADVILICRYIMGDAVLSGTEFAAADINNDGKVNAADGVLLCQMISEGNE
ncbi:MAG: dockerin type I domain-containing protein, partial [Christensenellaceae bacterium]|nr:dockerin type I domain-containing protein [Christensenellaceae bacterium]